MEQVHSEAVPMSDPGGANGPINPGEAECPMVHAGFEGGRSADTGARATVQIERSTQRLEELSD